MRDINATEFKARCLALLDEVAETGEVLTIRKHGRAVAQVQPWVPRWDGPPQTRLAGTVKFFGDVVRPALPHRAWDTERGEGP